MGDQIIELGLHQEAPLVFVIDRILGILPEAAGDAEKLQTAQFRQEIERCREQLRSSRDVDTVARRVLDLCQDYFKRARVYRLERELEYIEMLEVLRGAISKLAGDTTNFNAQLLSSSERLDKLTEVEDIREIKKQIAREVQGLRHAVEEKQKQDEYNVSFLSRRIETLQVTLSRVQDEAATDSLTRIPNRGSFEKTISGWIAEHSGSSETFVLALLDIDDFKRINDTHGHRIGDRVLVAAADLLAQSIRPNDFVARYGGEEFAMLLAGMKLAPAESRLTQLIQSIARHCFEYESGEVQFTVSCGIAEYALADTCESLVARADEAVYEAKRDGKNRVSSRRKSRLRSALSRP